MRLEFVKMSGAGNDFIVLDNMDSSLDTVITPELIRNLCLRGLSVGADGLLEMRSDPEYLFHMKYYNSNGKRAGMCGNGGRCMVAYAASRGIVPDSGVFRFRSDAGVHSAEITAPESVRLWMTDPEIHYLDRSIDLESTNLHLSFLDTGVPHAVVMLDGSEDISFSALASKLRKHSLFGNAGANVDFVRIRGVSELEIRTWEMGVEGETLACGTGAVASAICAASIHGMNLPIDITVRSGMKLKVGKNSNGWWLQGEARAVYSGILECKCVESLTKAL
ncbi:MAG: diaminopimelate epimerase [Candidatus Aegiribacteria sp.]|nr:diaminopimelate epimerase [Candidatus Aegiribacteria sp.]